MSATKNYFEEQLSRTSRQQELVDADYHYEKWSREEDERIEKAAEEAEFFETFRTTGSYPF